MFRLCWITALICIGSFGAYFSKAYNATSKSLYFWLIFTAGIAGNCLWANVARRSDNLIFDNVVFDIVISLAYVGVFVLLGCSESFKLVNWIGIATVLVGLVLLKI